MKNAFIILFLIGSQILISQSVKISATKTDQLFFEADDFIGFDGFGSCFYIKNNTVFKKVDTTVLQYQNLSLGKVTKVDILNPLKVILFYKEFNSIVVLDNQMNEIQRVDFSKLDNTVIASAVGISGQNKIWVFNSMNQQIGLYDLTNNSYQNLGVPIKDELQHYQSDFNYFHWIDSQHQWNTCTIFGRVFSNGKMGEMSEIQLLDIDKVLFAKNNQMYLNDIKQNKLYEIEIVEKSFKKFYYKDQILSIFTDKGITNYKITIP